MWGTETKATILSAALLLLLLPTFCQARRNRCHEPLNRDDLDTFVILFQGEFNSYEQNERDRHEGMMGRDLHMYLKLLHVPVTVPALQEAPGQCAHTRQFYMEQCFNGLPDPQLQRIGNVILKNGRITMEVHNPRDPSAAKGWENWRNDTEQFRSLTSGDLEFDPKCTMEWTKTAPGKFRGRIVGNRCVFDNRGTKMYFRSDVNLTDDVMYQNDQYLTRNETNGREKVVLGDTTPYEYERTTRPIPSADCNDHGNGNLSVQCILRELVTMTKRAKHKHFNFERFTLLMRIVSKLIDLSDTP
ncbi:uncharacterized protein LOC143300387 [Babylonia areolata]|uniref:uncharacterized protein LOC143300387 n=1 Tax=Babylonia areolata TaxID=304850 RepID=UPI003FD01BD7